MDLGEPCKTGSFADGTKLQGKIGIAGDTLGVQEDLDSVIAWSIKITCHLKKTSSFILDIAQISRHCSTNCHSLQSMTQI